MRKSKKIIAAILGCIMLIGASTASYAANDWTICGCGRKMPAIYSTGASCTSSGCRSTVYFYRCSEYSANPTYHSARAACTSGHLN